MKHYLRFIAIGSFFSTVEEFLTVVVLKNDVASYVFTLLILFPVFLSLVYFSSWVSDRMFRHEPARELAHFFIYGFAGLMIEWFLIGLSPWSNPGANVLAMLAFQLGMFSFWATVAFAPRLFLNRHELSQRIARRLLRFYASYFAIVYLIAFLVPRAAKFATIISLIVFGYLFLNVFYGIYFYRALMTRGRSELDGQENALPARLR